MKTYQKIIILFFALWLRNPSLAFSENIPVDSVVAKLEEGQAALKDFSCEFVTTTGDTGSMSKFKDLMEKSTGQALPTENLEQVWIKTPYLMKTRDVFGDQAVDQVFKKEGEEFYLYNWMSQSRTLDKAKMPAAAWPAYPGPEAEVATIKEFIKKADPTTMIEAKDENGQYVLTISSKNRKDIHFIDKSMGLVTKSELYENGNLSMTYEWRNIKLNTGLSDDFFEFKLPQNVKRTFRDLSQVQKKNP